MFSQQLGIHNCLGQTDIHLVNTDREIYFCNIQHHATLCHLVYYIYKEMHQYEFDRKEISILSTKMLAVFSTLFLATFPETKTTCEMW